MGMMNGHQWSTGNGQTMMNSMDRGQLGQQQGMDLDSECVVSNWGMGWDIDSSSS